MCGEVERYKMPPKYSKVWLYFMPGLSDGNRCKTAEGLCQERFHSFRVKQGKKIYQMKGHFKSTGIFFKQNPIRIAILTMKW